MGHLQPGFTLAAAKVADVTTTTQIRPLGRDPANPPASLHVTNGGTSPLNGKWPRRQATLPVHRSILAVDIEDSTRRTNTVKEELRSQVYRLVREALGVTGIDDHYYEPFTDRGDGVLVLLRPVDEFPKPLLLSCLIPALARLLAAHNSGIPLAEQPRILRLRAVIHAGEVHYDGKGFYGEDLDVAFRLLDAPQLKAHLRSATTPLALVASEYFYHSIIRHGYDGIDDGEFFPLVTVNVGNQRRKGWVHLPQTAEFPMPVPPVPAQARAS
jgi:class 3 adenylate cyclase